MTTTPRTAKDYGNHPWIDAACTVWKDEKWHSVVPTADLADLLARVDTAEAMLTALGDIAVGCWDDPTVGKVDGALSHETRLKYKDMLRALFVDNPKELTALRGTLVMLKRELDPHISDPLKYELPKTAWEEVARRHETPPADKEGAP